MIGVPHPTADRLVGAYCQLVEEGVAAAQITTRMVADRAGTSVSAVAFHFGSLDELIAAVGMGAYNRLNRERLQILQTAIFAHRPEPPPVRSVLDALIRPPVLWHLRGDGAYGVLMHISTLLSTCRDPGRFRALEASMQPHRVIMAQLRAHAPWLSEAEIGWRVSAILGIRSQVLRRRYRCDAFTGGRLDLDDPEAVIEAILDLAVPMFAAPDAASAPRHRF
ncbi:TetR family transcriptional regulator [Polymorphum gilvum]|uniref:TetR family transcription factor n=1 Tax=Polymorphum gilvum (strain LMG 25793 / CGMCC 1.9160 / SL003B-26A1) TaxID=991905 RepID=F2J1Q3_POLGS|nr:TetR family transcriptional regulator [Polymorphum gilvum]ADZ70854.1 TetR family transcription factor [Polymorphum gilvum SL003B-26A1]